MDYLFFSFSQLRCSTKEKRGKLNNPCSVSRKEISIECVVNADGVPGVVVYGDRTFAISSEQDTVVERTASGDGLGPYSSVRPFQVAHYENEDPAAQDLAPIWTDSISPASLQEEETEEDDWRRLQPST
ncbi:uncharacterized protein PEZ65_017439 [Lycodopsis pacificus]